jgi:hypothetical protein
MRIFDNLGILQSQISNKLNPSTNGLIPLILNPNNLTQYAGV